MTRASDPLVGLDESPLPLLPGVDESLGAVRLFVRRSEGAGERAVYVHGLGGSSTNWTDLMHLLGDRLAGEAPDLPGFGWSPPPPHGDYRLSRHADAVTALLTAGPTPVHLFGNSLGGAVATLVAARRPDLVRTLTLVSPALPMYRPRASSAPLPLMLVPGVQRLIRRRLAAMPVEARVAQVIALCYSDPTLAHPQRVAEAVAELTRRADLAHNELALIGSLRSLLGSYFHPGREYLWRAARRVTAPTLLLFGTRDKLVDAHIAPKAARLFRDSRLVMLDGVGHVAQMERPAAVAAAVVDRLDELAGRPTGRG